MNSVRVGVGGVLQDNKGRLFFVEKEESAGSRLLVDSGWSGGIW